MSNEDSMNCSMKSEVKHVELQVSLFFLFLISFLSFFSLFFQQLLCNE